MAVVLSLTSLAPADASLPPSPRTPESIRVENQCTVRGLLAKGSSSLNTPPVIHCRSVYKSIGRPPRLCCTRTDVSADGQGHRARNTARVHTFFFFFTLSVLSRFHVLKFFSGFAGWVKHRS